MNPTVPKHVLFYFPLRFMLLLLPARQSYLVLNQVPADPNRLSATI